MSVQTMTKDENKGTLEKFKELKTFFKNDVFKVSNPDSKLSMPTKENITKYLTIDPNFGPIYKGMIDFFPFYIKNYENDPKYDQEYTTSITKTRQDILDKLAAYTAKYEDTFKRGKENIIEKRNTKEKYAREDRLILDQNVKEGSGYITALLVATGKWFVDTTITGIKNMFTTGWNKTITGFLIIVFIIILIFVIPKMKKKKDAGAKKQDNSIMSILLAIPQDISLAFSDFTIAFGDFTDTVNNTMETLNNTVTSINAQTPDLIDRGRETEGRGGDNLFHIKGSYIKSDSNIDADKIYNIYKPSSQSIKGGDVKLNSKTITKANSKYEIDCSSLTDDTTNKYIDGMCRLKTEIAKSPEDIDIEDKTDYVNIKLD
jgi:hypothetical protein